MRCFAVTFLLLAAAFGQQNTSPTDNFPPDHKAPAPVRQAPDDPGSAKARHLIDQMIEALGGNAYMSYTDMEQSGRTYGFTSGGEPAGTGTVFWRMWKWPDKDRIELTKQRDWIIIHNGDQGNEVTFRGVSPEEKQPLEDFLRRRYYSLETVLRTWLQQPGTAVFYEGQASANRKPADQVSIMNAKNEALTIYIDQNTHLPVRKTFTWRDPADRERMEEAENYDNYKPIQGIMTPLSITRQKNGSNTNQRFITAVSYNKGLPDSMFDAAAQGKPAATTKKK
jgi:hypothetical protein